MLFLEEILFFYVFQCIVALIRLKYANLRNIYDLKLLVWMLEGQNMNIHQYQGCFRNSRSIYVAIDTKRSKYSIISDRGESTIYFPYSFHVTYLEIERLYNVDPHF